MTRKRRSDICTKQRTRKTKKEGRRKEGRDIFKPIIRYKCSRSCNTAPAQGKGEVVGKRAGRERRREEHQEQQVVHIIWSCMYYGLVRPGYEASTWDENPNKATTSRGRRYKAHVPIALIGRYA